MYRYLSRQPVNWQPDYFTGSLRTGEQRLTRLRRWGHSLTRSMTAWRWGQWQKGQIYGVGRESVGSVRLSRIRWAGVKNLSPLMSAESSSARDCIKTTRDSEVQTPLRGVALNEIYVTDLGSIETVMDSMTTNSLKTASVHMVTSTGLQYASVPTLGVSIMNYMADESVCWIG